MVGVAGRTLVALTVDLASAQLQAWTAPVPDGVDSRIAWTPRPEVASSLAELSLVQLVAADDQLIAIGHRYSDGGLALLRTADGIGWEELDASAVEAAGLEAFAASGSTIAAVGHDLTDAGASPRFWTSVAGERWQPESDPALGPTTSAVVGGCPDLPSEMIDWLAIPDAVGAECFGDAPMTFTAWSTVGGGCGGSFPGTFEPTWLAHPFARYPFILTPMPAEQGGCGSAAAAPGVASVEPQRWIEVTGHWSDAAAESCRYLPDPMVPGSTGPIDLVFRCRATFVVTDAHEVEGP
jgi:hypothetical protein